MVVRRDALLWLESARDDVEVPNLLGAGRCLRSAFLTQQAADRALKALFFTVGREEPKAAYSDRTMLKEHGFTLPKVLEEHPSMLTNTTL
ncbi:MAG: HEPN domain-containing protein [Candidatus Nitrosocaldus sp.]|nr:HEPN domain-containing protein [Candidatus Nitrosocaldus sp.]MDW8001016.1 HEPN domain-containing protein [Candidatus Nitrosocaldus sp.]MDW8275206.1 HEPN domain-containing protein [Candidatus Nitrosocaldus sp.]